MDGTEVEVRAVRTVGPDTVALELETPPDFDAQPGQFVQLSVRTDALEGRSADGSDAGEEITRHYTLSSPTVEDTFEITVGVDPEGDLSPWLADREHGDTVEIAGPFGRSYYEGEERVIVLAGGPGVGPAVGIGERALAEREGRSPSDRSSGARRERGEGLGEAASDVVIVYRDDEPAHEERLSALADRGADVVVTAADPSEDDRVLELLSTADGQTFVYGFAEFLESARDAIAAAGGDPDDAKMENFG